MHIDRTHLRKAMQIITNTILHVTGLFVFLNTANLALTGNWLFFNKTRSAKAINAVSEDIKTLVTVDKTQTMREQMGSLREEDWEVTAKIDPKAGSTV